MDRERVLGGSPLGVAIRLVLLSIVVGIVMSALGITPANLFYHLDLLVRRLYDLGFAWIEWLLGYFLLGAIVVFPIWIVARLIGVIGTRAGDR
ncbi:MAG TPA: DUF6460 domain-containing protein [Hyphomicrobiaceae bacterium]|nr:DUF6460 domain-containing protein [Hyphomicrobiaceae bacterium]